MPDLKVAGLTLSPLTAAVTLLTIDRLEQRNALSLVMWQAIPSILTSQLEQGTKVLVITGSHNLFCAGADFNDLRQICGAESKARALDSHCDCFKCPG
ncbi:MAG: enoyl-CoA hydratase/isomerase family protein [Candidatus Obscuribacter sp.]|nr:enoyl-CoA hydratase/isomerase family protein [Candidatus Obscuribacter sp.]